jgi:hypothetical protein
MMQIWLVQMYEQQQSLGLESEKANVDSAMVDTKLDKNASSADISPLPKETPLQEDDVSEFLLSALSIIRTRYVYRKEQEVLEKARLTDSEKAEVLADMFGEMRTLDHQFGKRVKNDLATGSIEFLVREKRRDFDRIRAGEKQALLIAQEKARPKEFSDARLVKFLRCEGMNTKAKLFAYRFVVLASQTRVAKTTY